MPYAAASGASEVPELNEKPLRRYFKRGRLVFYGPCNAHSSLRPAPMHFQLFGHDGIGRRQMYLSDPSNIHLDINPTIHTIGYARTQSIVV